MEEAKAAVKEFTSRHGHHTEVEEVVKPAITSEQVKPHHHQEFTHAIDREHHQHHYHTTVQPIAHQEILPEKHHHHMLPVETKEFHHGNEDAIRQKLETEATQFKDTSITHETHRTKTTLPMVAAEHVHHHVHEIVQPIIHKEVITPEVVHTTVPIHETHHAEAKHHGLSVLPMKTLADFAGTGGSLTGTKSASHESYEGAPRPYNKDLQTTLAKLGLGHDHHSDSGVNGVGTHTNGPHDSRIANKADPRVDSDRDGQSGLGNTTGPGATSRLTGKSTAGPHDSNIENKADPRVDSDLDGKSGFGNTSGGRTTNNFTANSTTNRVSNSNPLAHNNFDGRLGQANTSGTNNATRF